MQLCIHQNNPRISRFGKNAAFSEAGTRAQQHARFETDLLQAEPARSDLLFAEIEIRNLPRQRGGDLFVGVR